MNPSNYQFNPVKQSVYDSQQCFVAHSCLVQYSPETNLWWWWFVNTWIDAYISYAMMVSVMDF